MAHPGSGYATRRRNELFDALVELFLAEGFAHLTLEEIATRLRCSKSTLYTLAGSKEQLVRAATVYFFRRGADDIEDQIAGVTGARDRINAYLSAVGQALRPASNQFMNDLDAFAPAREVYEQNMTIAARRVQALINQGVAEGEFRDVNAAFAADLVTTMMVRIQQSGLRASTGLDDADAYRELGTILTAGIGT